MRNLRLIESHRVLVVASWKGYGGAAVVSRGKTVGTGDAGTFSGDWWFQEVAITFDFEPRWYRGFWVFRQVDGITGDSWVVARLVESGSGNRARASVCVRAWVVVNLGKIMLTRRSSGTDSKGFHE